MWPQCNSIVGAMYTPVFATWFQQQLKRRGWNQSDFHRESSIAKSTISSWYRGIRVPDPDQCERIAEAFDFDLDLVLDKAGHRPGGFGEPNDDLADDLHAMIDGHPIPVTVDLVDAIRQVLKLHAGREPQPVPS